MEVSIIDYNTGNLGSVKNIVKKAGGKAKIISTKEEVLEAKRIILPGVGSFDTAMKKLKDRNLIDAIKEKAISGTPTLGICLGMQLLCKKSEEGKINGLGLIDLEVQSFKEHISSQKKVPHMGWNVAKEAISNHPLLSDINSPMRFYFVHSYFVPLHKEYTLTTTQYDNDFSSAIQNKNILGVQFHPEKSHKYGMKLIHNFLENFNA